MLAYTFADYYAPLLFVAGLALIAWGIVRKRRRTRRPTAPVAPANPDALKASDIRAIAEELNNLMVELHEASRRIAAQVDNRATKLEILLQEADAKIARLEQLTGAAPSEVSASPAALTENPSAAASRNPDSLTLTNQHAASSTSAAPSAPADPRRAQIYSLADQGRSPREIAQLLSTQPGEIELILNLRPQHT